MTRATTIANSAYRAMFRSLVAVAGSRGRLGRNHSLRKEDQSGTQAEKSDHEKKHEQGLKHDAPSGFGKVASIK
jgi:hypothetical protein